MHSSQTGAVTGLSLESSAFLRHRLRVGLDVPHAPRSDLACKNAVDTSNVARSFLFFESMNKTGAVIERKQTTIVDVGDPDHR